LDSVAGVSLENVSKFFASKKAAVEQLNLEVRDQEFLVLVGPSGCGKSTTLRMVAGLETASSGSIRIGDRVVNDVSPKDRNIAMVFQSYALYPHMTVFDNLAFSLRLRYGGWFKRVWLRLTDRPQADVMAKERKAISERVKQASQILGIEPLLDRKPAQLSGGERQRVALGRAIVRRPEVFLFDEPLSNLDAKLRGEMRREIKNLHRTLQATMIYVTHDQVEALTMGDRIVVMNQGQVQQIGRPMEVYDSPVNQFVAGFIGSPPMNFVSGTINRREENWCFSGEGFQFEVQSQGESPEVSATFTCGVRPEHVRVRKSRETDNPHEKDGRVEVTLVELLGESSVVHVRSAEGKVVVCKAEARPTVAVGDRATIEVDPQQVHFFDPASGERV